MQWYVLFIAQCGCALLINNSLSKGFQINNWWLHFTYFVMVSDVKSKKLSIAEQTINATKRFFGEN